MKKNLLIFHALLIAFSTNTFANNLAQYPTYTSADGITPAEQVELEARWLHQNASNYGVIIPKSYDTNGYWQYLVINNKEYQDYRKMNDANSCRVGGGNDATIERVLAGNGLDIYDGAVWQIALSIASQANSTYVTDVKKYKDFLVNGLPTGFGSYRAFVSGGDGTPYLYNGKIMASSDKAYLLKFISPQYAGNHDTINSCNMNWPEWGAVTGEEAWAVFIGPIQSIYNLNDGSKNKNWSAVGQGAGEYIDLGKNALEAIQAMQDPVTGGVYRDVTQPNSPMSKNISLENDFSLYAGLSLLKQALLARAPQLHAAGMNSQQLFNSDQEALTMIESIQQGLLKFFSGKGGVEVYNKTNGYFYSSVDTTNLAATASSPYAVDVQTWGATVIANNPELLAAVQAAYGEDALYKMFQSTIQRSGYYSKDGKTLLGVGYTAQNDADAHYELSGEWTLGAINAAIVLADHYRADVDKKSILIKAAKDMLQGVITETSSLVGEKSKPTATLSYLYANKRAHIPFGWYSNVVPATASTGWSLMVNSCYNPFELGGGKHQVICNEVGIGG